MSPQVSVIVTASDVHVWGALTDLDRQRMAGAAFEVVVDVTAVKAEERRRLDELVRNRTNVILRSFPGGASPSEVLADARGQWVLVLPMGARLAPESLEDWSSFAHASGADVCLGPTARRGKRVPGSELVPRTTATVSSDVVAATPDHVRLFRASALSALTDAADTWDDLTARLLAEGRPVASWWSVAAVTLPEVTTGEPPRRSVLVEVESAALSGSHLSVRVRTDGVSRPTLCLHRASDGFEVHLTEEAYDKSRTGVELDLETLARETALPEGLWRLAALVEGQRADVAATGVRSAAIIRGRPVVLHTDDGVLGIDVGGLAHPIVGRLRAEEARVEETVRGSLLSVPVPALTMAPGEVFRGELRVGKRATKAWLEGHDDGPLLHSWMSGLAGSLALATRFSGSSFAPTGLELRIAPAGAMSIAHRRRSPRKTPAAIAREAGAGSRPIQVRRRLREQANRVPMARRLVRSVRALRTQVRQVRQVRGW